MKFAPNLLGEIKKKTSLFHEILLQQVLFTAEQNLAWQLDVLLLPLFSCAVFANLRTYFLNNFLEPPTTDPITTKHVICLRIKNMSFDYLLSYQSQGNTSYLQNESKSKPLK